MSDNTTNLVEVTNDVQFVYITIPKEYLCVYHKILVMLADYGIEMLKDCKASCTDRNSNVIECFNMFNAAVAAYKLNNTNLANTLITYVKAKIEQIYKGRVDTTFVFPLDEDNNIRSFVSCEDTIKLFINPVDNELFTNTFKEDGSIQQQFIIDTKDEDKPFSYDISYELSAHYNDEVLDTNNYEITITISNLKDKEGNIINIEDCKINWTLAGHFYNEIENVIIPKRVGYRTMSFVIYYNNKGVITTIPVLYQI